MLDTNDVRAIMDAQLQTVTDLPDFVAENTRYTPSNEPYVRSTIMGAKSEAVMWGAGVTMKLQGIYQVDVIAPSVTGTDLTAPICKAIQRAFFPGANVLTDGTYVVNVDSVTQLTAIEDESSMTYMVPVQVTWWAYTKAA